MSFTHPKYATHGAFQAYRGTAFHAPYGPSHTATVAVMGCCHIRSHYRRSRNPLHIVPAQRNNPLGSPCPDSNGRNSCNTAAW